MATKEHRRHARGLIEGLEYRVHLGPPIHDQEILSAKEFLRQNEFSPLSDYYSRLGKIQDRLQARSTTATVPTAKRNYGGAAAGYWMQLQSAYDHVILSTCYEGEVNCRHGRVKISHRFNQEGRIDFVELKFLRSLHPCLDGALRKLLTVNGYQNGRRDWHTAEAFVLEVLPQELVFLYPDVFRCPKADLFGWLINIGHGLVGDLLEELRGRSQAVNPRQNGSQSNQLELAAVLSDDVALPILEGAASLEAAVEMQDPKSVEVRYVTKSRSGAA